VAATADAAAKRRKAGRDTAKGAGESADNGNNKRETRSRSRTKLESRTATQPERIADRNARGAQQTSTPAATAASAEDEGRRRQQPDVVVLLTDDMRAEDWQALPETRRRLAERGTTFENFVLTTPICSPSRASILTGMYAHNHRVLNNGKADGGFAAFRNNQLADRSIAVALQAVGYRTAMIGKFLNGYDAEPPVAGWDRWLATDERDYYGPRLVEGRKLRQFGERAYVTDLLRDAAVAFVAETPPARPLFLYLSMRAPHGPAEPARGDRGAYADAEVARTAAFNEEDVGDKPANVRDRPPLKAKPLDKLEGKRLETLASADRAFVAVLDALEAAGRLDGAYVFALSDNGYMMGDHRIAKKGDPYDASIRAPMIAVGPGFAAGAESDRLAANVDLAPTIAAAAGAALPEADGRDLLAKWDRGTMLVEGFQKGGFQGLRGEDYLYVEHPAGEREYYDYRTDPLELDNALANWDGRTPTLDPVEAERLRGLLARYVDCAGESCP
jgi:arylsulfatase A-like enzyme